MKLINLLFRVFTLVGAGLLVGGVIFLRQLPRQAIVAILIGGLLMAPIWVIPTLRFVGKIIYGFFKTLFRGGYSPRPLNTLDSLPRRSGRKQEPKKSALYRTK